MTVQLRGFVASCLVDISSISVFLSFNFIDLWHIHFRTDAKHVAMRWTAAACSAGLNMT